MIKGKDSEVFKERGLPTKRKICNAFHLATMHLSYIRKRGFHFHSNQHRTLIKRVLKLPNVIRFIRYVYVFTFQTGIAIWLEENLNLMSGIKHIFSLWSNALI
jgi:hypothetical protein